MSYMHDLTKFYQSKGTNFGDGLCSGISQNSINSSRGLRTHIVKSSYIYTWQPVVLSTQTFNSEVYLNLNTMVTTNPNAVSLVQFSDNTAVKFDYPRKFKIFTGSITNFTAKISGYNSSLDKICSIVSTTSGTMEISNFAYLTSIKIYNFTAGTPVTLSVTTTNKIEVPTTDIGCIASYFTNNNLPNYVADANGIFTLKSGYEFANLTTNKLPYVDLGGTGSNNIIVFSFNTGYGANIDLNDSVIKYMPIPINKNYTPSMIEGVTNTDLTNWEGWRG